MKITGEKNKGLQFNLSEFNGSLGDFGTIIPIIMGVAIVSDINISTIFLFFSIWFIIAGLLYRLPIPIEPMKVIGAIVIAEGLAAPEIAASGIILGMIFLFFGVIRGMKRISDYIPESIIRGIQIGLALLLIRTSFGLLTDDPGFAVFSVILILIFMAGSYYGKIPDLSAIFLLIIGIGSAIIIGGVQLNFGIPLPLITIPDIHLFAPAFWNLVLPQIPLTLTNAILATSLLSLDLFKEKVSDDKLSATIGIMNLISAPLGGFPMCHGAGGLAAQYRFGARTGGANIIAGIIMLGFAFFFTSPEMLSAIPVGIFGALLIFVSVTLIQSGRKTDSYLISGIIAVSAFFAGMTFAFILGMGIYYILMKIKKNRGPEDFSNT